MVFLVGLLNLLGFIAIAGVMLLLYGAGGGHPWESRTLGAYSGMLMYCFISFISTLPFVRSSAMSGMGVLANLMLLPVLSLATEAVAVLMFLAPFVVLTLLWLVAYRARRDPKDA